ncbi:MAG: hypothetical protein HUN04_15610 [Desulfobacter sp.]|nr:MAG: hypothetical protein HUN04_15610 [Desulfobacter sp.]
MPAGTRGGCPGAAVNGIRLLHGMGDVLSVPVPRYSPTRRPGETGLCVCCGPLAPFR